MFRNGLTPAHVIVVLIVLVLLLGATRRPDVATSVGRSLTSFATAMRGLTSTDVAAAADPPRARPLPPPAAPSGSDPVTPAGAGPQV